MRRRKRASSASLNSLHLMKQQPRLTQVVTHALSLFLLSRLFFVLFFAFLFADPAPLSAKTIKYYFTNAILKNKSCPASFLTSLNDDSKCSTLQHSPIHTSIHTLVGRDYLSKCHLLNGSGNLSHTDDTASEAIWGLTCKLHRSRIETSNVRSLDNHFTT